MFTIVITIPENIHKIQKNVGIFDILRFLIYGIINQSMPTRYYIVIIAVFFGHHIII